MTAVIVGAYEDAAAALAALAEREAGTNEWTFAEMALRMVREARTEGEAE